MWGDGPVLRRSNIFIATGRKFSESSVGAAYPWQPGRLDVAPMELYAFCVWCIYKDFAPTELPHHAPLYQNPHRQQPGILA
jgi:hypothetical protein